jgi:hypothetical protein
MRSGPGTSKAADPRLVFLTSNEVSKVLKVSLSWLAKARMRGDGPPYFRFGRSVRYSDIGVAEYAKSRQRLSTTER